MRSHGHKPDIFGNIKSGMARKKAAEPPQTAEKTTSAKPQVPAKKTPAGK
jgi:YidC/Oxa1 family membrane protein insertase